MLQHGDQIQDLGEYFNKLWFINTIDRVLNIIQVSKAFLKMFYLATPGLSCGMDLVL